MDRSSFASSERKVYRFNRLYRWYHFIVGAAACLGAAVSFHLFVVLSIGLALFSAFMISRPLVTSVTIDQYSVTLKTMFSEHSLQRSSITAIETVHTGKGNSLIFHGNEGKEGLAIGVNLFAFDEAWDEWLSTYRDLSDNKPLSLFPPSRR